MANENKKINKLVTEDDDDTTAELEVLSGSALTEDETGPEVETESDANTYDFDNPESGTGDDDVTISGLKSDLKARAESINKLQFDIEQLRSRWSGLEKELKVREDVTKNLTLDLKAVHKKQTRTTRLLRQRDKEIASLQTRLSKQERSLQESTELLEKADENEQAAESRVAEIQAHLETTQEELAALDTKSRREQKKYQDAKDQLRSHAEELKALRKELAGSRATVTELQHYVDSRKSEWQRQESQLRENEKKIKQLTVELESANASLSGSGSAHEDMNARLDALIAERDELLSEITQLRNDSQDDKGAAADKQLLAEQTGLLAGQNFEISELRNQIVRTEQYADELRKQLQDQSSLTERLQTRQKHLEISLTGANTQVEELSSSIDELRASNANLTKEKSTLQEEFEKEIRQIRLELGEAEETIADRDSLSQQLASDLLDTREFKMNLEGRLSKTEEENKATIAELKRKLARLEIQNEELTEKLSTKDNAISALLRELTKRSETIESIGEIEDVIHELDDRMSEQIDERSIADKERITRLLIGKIDGQKLRFPLFKNRLTIGRTGHNDIQLKAPFISRRHAVIVTEDDSTRIVDWGSKNGVFVNATRIKEQILRNGDIVTIGTADFKFEERPKR
jgi:chromosome segregation ATPase